MKTRMHFPKSSMLFVLPVLLIAAAAFSQSITNTLGNSGTFTIKDVSSNYLTLSQSSGQVNILKTLRLENTINSITGIVFKGAERFLHNYGSNNTFLGINSGNLILTGSENTSVGTGTLTLNTSGTSNTAMGFNSLSANSSGSNNTAIGVYSLKSNTTGSDNTSLGEKSLFTNTTGNGNTALGLRSLYSNTTGSNNTAIGLNSLIDNSIGGNNTSLGKESLKSNTSGNNNTSVGQNALFTNTTGSDNTAVGSETMFNNTTGTLNTAVGKESLNSNTTGFNNSVFGDHAGSTITTGSNLTCIGKDAAPTTGTATNQITLGNNSVTSLRCNVTTITSLSDARDKKNIKDLELGIGFIMKLNPRQFNWDKREWYEDNISDGSKMNETPTAGFIAQELDEVQTVENAEWLNLVLKDNPEKIEATYGNLLPVMVKAIQDLKEENDMLKQQIELLIKDAESFNSVNEKLLKLEKLVNQLSSVRNDSPKDSDQVKVISYDQEVK